MDAFVGQLLLVPYNFAPYQWQFCQGQTLSISQNAALFSLLGNNYGGDGKSNFKLPDMRGRVAVGFGQAPGLTPYVIGQNGGQESVTLNTSQMPQHLHTVMGVARPASQPTPGAAALGEAAIYATGTPSTVMNGAALGIVGSTGPHTNIMPYLTLNWIIAMVGIFPTRS